MINWSSEPNLLIATAMVISWFMIYFLHMNFNKNCNNINMYLISILLISVISMWSGLYLITLHFKNDYDN